LLNFFFQVTYILTIFRPTVNQIKVAHVKKMFGKITILKIIIIIIITENDGFAAVERSFNLQVSFSLIIIFKLWLILIIRKFLLFFIYKIGALHKLRWSNVQIPLLNANIIIKPKSRDCNKNTKTRNNFFSDKSKSCPKNTKIGIFILCCWWRNKTFWKHIVLSRHNHVTHEKI